MRAGAIRGGAWLGQGSTKGTGKRKHEMREEV